MRTEDTSPPQVVTDLSTLSWTDSSVTLVWTAPGDDGMEGTASGYDLRYSVLLDAVQGWWDSLCVRVDGLPAPRPAGQSETLTIGSLPPNMTYWFGLKTRDEALNWSIASNLAEVTTGPREGALTQVTFDPSSDTAPDWSPDGTEIAFVSDRDGFSNVWVVSVSTGEVRQLTHRGFVRDPSWSLDGSQIVFTSSGIGATTGLWVVPSEGGTAVRLTTSTRNDMYGAWSPDGSRIAFASDRNSMDFDIWVMTAVGDSAVQLTFDPAADLCPAWSPDGMRIAFTSRRSGENGIWVMPATGGAPSPIALYPGPYALPSWSPDGTRIAYTSTLLHESQHIWVAPESSGTQVQVTTFPGYNQHPCWSPDSRRIAFSSTRSGNFDIWIIEVE